MHKMAKLKKNRKIVSDNICELTIIINGENAETNPAKIKRFLFRVLAMNAIIKQFIASTIICIIKMLNKFSPTSQAAS